MTTALAPHVESRAVASRAGKFGLVGLVGLAVNLLMQALFTELIGLNYLLSAVMSTQVSSTFNFLLAERWVFDRGNGEGLGLWARYGSFLAMNNVALLIRAPMMWVLVDGAGVHYSVANFMSLAVLTLVRFGIADRFIWKIRSAVVEAEEEELVLEKQSARTATIAEALTEDNPAAPAITSEDVLSPRTKYIGLALIVSVGAFLRLWKLMSIGFNSDEAVYASQAAGIAGDQAVSQYFPIFRAHPFLFQAILSVPYQLFGTSDVVGRLASVSFGLATIVMVFVTARLLYGARVALIAAGIVALMPYHVIITRQVLLDGPMAFFATLSLYFVAKYVLTRHLAWLLAASCGLGLTTLAKETYIILVGSVFMFFALSPEIRLRFRDMVAAVGVFVLTLLPHPITVVAAGKSETGKSYLSWQLFRRPNHGFGFYVATLGPYIGWLVVVCGVLGLVATWGRTRTWRERLLVSWILVPTVFLTVWPVKGFHYLLAAALPLAMLAALGIDRALESLASWLERREGTSPARVAFVSIVPDLVLVVVALSLAIPSWQGVQPRTSDSFLAGIGGLPGGREAGEWIEANTPEGAEFMTVGPSMANLVQWYGHRKAYGMSVSPNPLNRNPSYEPIANADRAIRTNELQYVIWDAYSTKRSEFFGEKVIAYAERYHGRPVYTYESDGRPVIIVFEVRP